MSSIPKLTDCAPGLLPRGFNVLVAIAGVEERTKGGVYLPPSAAEKDQMVHVRGRIVAVSPAAFDFADFGDSKPKVGDAVQFAKLAGIQTKGADGKDYRLLLDKDIAAILDEEAFEEAA
jgi:chaperonin GroES